MPMNLENVGGVSEPGKNSWTSKDALLYALGVGAGQADPTGFELEFTTENSMNTEQRVLPTLPVVVAMGGGANAPKWGDFDFRASNRLWALGQEKAAWIFRTDSYAPR